MYHNNKWYIATKNLFNVLIISLISLINMILLISGIQAIRWYIFYVSLTVKKNPQYVPQKIKGRDNFIIVDYLFFYYNFYCKIVDIKRYISYHFSKLLLTHPIKKWNRKFCNDRRQIPSFIYTLLTYPEEARDSE